MSAHKFCVALILAGAFTGSAGAAPLSLFPPSMPAPQSTYAMPDQSSTFRPFVPPAQAVAPQALSYAPQAPSYSEPEDNSGAVQPRFRRQVVEYPTREPVGTIVIDTPNTYLYYVLGNGRAVRYGIGVGRDGFTWAGTQTITRKAEWPDWFPPPEMIARQPYLPRFMAGGPTNPLGARAMYLGGTEYRIHGTNAPQTIGGRVSSGCIRLTNEDIEDLYERARVGTRVVVMPMTHRAARPVHAASN